MLLEEATSLSKMLQRELLAPQQGGGNRDIYRDGSTDRDKEVNDEGESGHEEGTKEGRVGGNDGDSEARSLMRTATVVVRVRTGQERTKRGRGVATKRGGRTGVCAE